MLPDPLRHQRPGDRRPRRARRDGDLRLAVAEEDLDVVAGDQRLRLRGRRRRGAAAALATVRRIAAGSLGARGDEAPPATVERAS